MLCLIACEETGKVRNALAKRGHRVVSCDLKPSRTEGQHHQGDVLPLLREFDWDMVIAFPPCTHLASSGAGHFAEKIADGRQQEGIDFFLEFTKLTCMWCIENPVGIMSKKFRKPDQYIQPYQFGHAETKKTCLWLSKLPLLKPTNVVEPDFMRRPDGSYYRDKKGKRYSRVHFLSGRSQDRAAIRSETYDGIAQAMADQWG